MTAPTASCATCQFFVPGDDHSTHPPQPYGVCRRYPPSGAGHATWPRVDASGWCGEFKQAAA